MAGGTAFGFNLAIYVMIAAVFAAAGFVIFKVRGFVRAFDSEAPGAATPASQPAGELP